MKIFRIIKSMHWYHYTVVALTIVGGVSAIVYANSSDNSRTTHSEQTQPYEYAALGTQCNEGASHLKEWSKSLSTQAETDYTKTNNEIAQMEAQISTNTSYNTQVLNSARQDYTEIHNQGGSTDEQYERRLDGTFDAQDSIGSSATELRNGLSKLRTDSTKLYEDTKKKASEYLTDASKLDVCASSAAAKKQFTVSDVAEFNSIISKYIKP